MTVLSAATSRKRQDVHLMRRGQEIAIATASVVYHGALVSMDETTGRMKPASKTAGETFLGVADLSDHVEDALTGDTAGTVKASFVWGHLEKIAVEAALTQAYTTANVAVEDDNGVTTLSDAGTAGVQVVVGQMVQLDTDAWVAIRHYGYKDAP